MNEPAGPGSKLDPLTAVLLAVAFALAGPVIALAPLGMAPLLVAAAVSATAVERVRSGMWPAPPRQAIRLSALFLGWCAITIAWDLNPASGARKLTDMILIFASALCLLGLAERANPAQRRGAARGLACGAIAGLTLLFVETGFGFPLYRAVMGDSNPKLADLLLSKRSVDAVPLLVWPGAFALARLGRPWAGAALAAIFAAASFRLTASSATLGMLAGLLTLALAAWSTGAARRLTAIMIIAAFVLIIPGAIAAYDSGAAHVPWLKFSAHHRLEIWHFAAERSLEQPLFGHGINASRYVPNGGEVSEFQAPGKPIMTLHPHDAFLQVWVELGLVGVALAAALLLSALSATAAWPRRAQPFALAAYVSGLTVAGLAFGIWQTWWMATLGFAAAACAFLGAGDLLSSPRDATQRPAAPAHAG